LPPHPDCPMAASKVPGLVMVQRTGVPDMVLVDRSVTWYMLKLKVQLVVAEQSLVMSLTSHHRFGTGCSMSMAAKVLCAKRVRAASKRMAWLNILVNGDIPEKKWSRYKPRTSDWEEG